LLSTGLADVLEDAEVVVIGTRGVDRDELSRSLRRDQVVIDLVNLERASRPATPGDYKGICW
jgi:hypothetical protein